MVENPKAFEAYSPDRFIEIVKAWANHSWPITTEEARELYESLGYRANPSDPSLFISDLSADGEPDSYYTSIDNPVNSIRLADEWTIRSDEWTLDNDVRIGIGNIGVTIAFFISSPYMTQLLREEKEMGLTSYDDILEDD